MAHWVDGSREELIISDLDMFRKHCFDTLTQFCKGFLLVRNIAPMPEPTLIANANAAASSSSSTLLDETSTLPVGSPCSSPTPVGSPVARDGEGGDTECVADVGTVASTLSPAESLTMLQFVRANNVSGAPSLQPAFRTVQGSVYQRLSLHPLDTQQDSMSPDDSASQVHSSASSHLVPSPWVRTLRTIVECVTAVIPAKWVIEAYSILHDGSDHTAFFRDEPEMLAFLKLRFRWISSLLYQYTADASSGLPSHAVNAAFNTASHSEVIAAAEALVDNDSEVFYFWSSLTRWLVDQMPADDCKGATNNQCLAKSELPRISTGPG